MARKNAPSITWPKPDFSRVPYKVFSDPGVFQDEQTRVFRGPVWCYLCLEVEIPGVGDFVTSYVGDAEVVVTRNRAGEVTAFLNRCAHRGSTLVRRPRGNADLHTCVYHHWCYNTDGDLVSVPFQRGLRGKGGMPSTFNKSEHGLKRLRVRVYRGVVFGTFSDEAEPFETYAGEPVLEFLDGMFAKPIRVIGYLRQMMPANWKLYFENICDSYHAGLLHQFQATFGIYRNTQEGGAVMDPARRHTITYSIHDSDDPQTVEEAYGGTGVYDSQLRLNDSSITDFRDEVGDRRATNMLAFFPNVMIQRLTNTLATRQIRPKSPDEFELYWTYFGYEDDDLELRKMRLKQVNLVGPAGLISMEDGEAGVLIQKAVRASSEGHSIIEMGGIGPIVDQDNVRTEVPIRGFWRNYAELMHFSPDVNG